MKLQKFFCFRLITPNNWFLTNMVSSIITLLLFNLLWVTTSLADVTIPEDVLEQIQQNDSVRILVKLDIPWKAEGKPKTSKAAERIKTQRDTIKLAQDTFKDRLTQAQGTSILRKKGSNLNIKEFVTVPYLGMEVDSKLLSELQKIPGIKQIELDSPDELLLTDSVPLIGANQAWQSGYTGQGQTVVLLDTGVDKTHPQLAGKVIRELCFSKQCPNGSTTQDGEGAAVPCPFSSYCDHGTHVAGIVTGVATGSKLIAEQVFSNYYSMPASYVSDQIAALEWVQLNYNSVNPPIAAINMSLGGGQYTAACDTDSRAAIINNLKSVGIVTIVASGNSGYTNSLSAPACVSSTISVGATDNSDNVAYFSNSASFLDVLAPGVDIESTLPGGEMGLKSGTSMAAPHVSGAWAILKSMFPTATVDSLLTDLKNNGVPITDTRNNITKSRINLAPFLVQITPQYTLTINSPSNGKVNSSDGKIDCGGSCVANYSSGQAVTLQGTANSGNQFQQWGGACSGTTNSITVTMNSAKTCTATFIPLYSLTITSPSNGNVTSQDGNISCGSQCSKEYPSGQVVTLQATANSGNQFQQWGGDCSGTTNPFTVTMNSAKTCTATFIPLYSLTITSPSNGNVTSQDGYISCGSQCSKEYPSGQSVTLQATANSGNRLKQWGGACSGTTNPLTLTMNSAKTCTATFETTSATVSLTVNKTGGGTGYINASLAGTADFSCKPTCPSYTKNYPVGTQIELLAYKQTGTWGGWSGDCSGKTNKIIVTLNTAKTCTAIFNATTSSTSITYPLTVTLSGNGKVSSSDGTIDCGSNCAADYLDGQAITLQATANSGNQFKQWGGDCNGTTNPITVTMNSAKTCTATFEPVSIQTYPLTVTLSGNGKVSSSDGTIDCGSNCVANYSSGQAVTLQATANSGNQFQQWGGACSGTTNSITVTMNSAKTCTATFIPLYSLTITSPSNGQVTSQDGNISCGSQCSKEYPSGQAVTLQATANSGNQFKQWGGDCSGTANPLTLTMNSAKVCTATFETTSSNTTVSLTVNKTGGGTGYINASLAGTANFSCKPTCSDYTKDYQVGTQIELLAYKQTGTWGGWSGDCSGKTNKIIVTLDTAKTCTAHFN
ncbi:peptidase S8/S53 subtilisin kexin sedolisin [Thioploca ingrica]|uniref:Peptidase S8/S53 subtilisin kexin sedolisin n=1 Tax=Thioploca ingrica TaxID=40754 RepID=A0A090ACY5_9GAMM|nr:peptidase S8/S53 subtilisin kexin sedolisin [Thioploca ingrica]